MEIKSNAGISKLAAVLQTQMKETTSSPLLLDFGVIQADKSLTTNTFPIAIPAGSYLVCRHLTYPCDTISDSAGSHFHSGGAHTHNGYQQKDGSDAALEDGEHTHKESGSHTHHIALTNQNLKSGDRVLVAWVGNDVIVIDVIVTGR